MSNRVLIVTYVYPDENGFQGGIFIHNQAVALTKAGMSVAILFLDFRSIRKKRKLGFYKYRIDNVTVYRFAFPCGPINWLMDCVSDTAVLSVYRWIERDFGRPDILHAHFSGAGLLARRISGIAKIPYIVTEHASSLLNGKISAKSKTKATFAYDGAGKVIAVSKALAEKVSALTSTDVIVIPNVLPDYMFEKTQVVKDSQIFSYVSIGNLIHSKRFDLTIKAFAEVHKGLPGTRLLIIGEGPLRKELEDLVTELEVLDSVTFLGKVANRELPRVYASCDCFVLPSEYETFGVVYAEAMACGLPVIATKCGGPEEFVDDAKGILVEKNNLRQLIAAMLDIRNRDAFLQPNQLSSFAYNTFSENKVAGRLMETYSSQLS